MPCPLQQVRASAAWVSRHASKVSVRTQGIMEYVAGLGMSDIEVMTSPQAFDAGTHYLGAGERTLQYFLTVDAINFCFWPEEELEYHHLATGLKESLLRDPCALDASKLAHLQDADIPGLLNWPGPIPLQQERATCLREVGQRLESKWNGSASKLVAAAGQSASRLVQLMIEQFPSFDDHATYKGRQVFFYKRAQIFAGDLWGAFQGEGLGCFHDISTLTSFADYRVPAVLRKLGVLEYSPDLGKKVDSGTLIAPASEEVEIRACAVHAVEELKAAIAKSFRGLLKEAPHSIHIDWWLWHIGERERGPHHRTLTTSY